MDDEQEYGKDKICHKLLFREVSSIFLRKVLILG